MVNSAGDEELAELLKAGDADAFTEIYARYWKLLYYVAAKRLRNYSEAEEAVQNIFTDLWARKASLVIRSSLKYYLAAAVQYQVMNQLARKKDVSEIDSSNDKASPSSADQYLSFHELEQQILALVTALPEKCRLVYQLSREHGFNNKEIALRLGISEKTVENQLTKALSRIRAGLGNQAILLLLLFSIKD